MPLYLPDIPDIRLGDEGVEKIMLGDTRVWPRIEPTRPYPLIDGQRYIFYAPDSRLQTYFGWTMQSVFAGGMTPAMISSWSGDSVYGAYYWSGGMLVTTAVTSGIGSYFTWVSENPLDSGTTYYIKMGQTSSGNTDLPALLYTTDITEAELFALDSQGHLISRQHFIDHVPLQMYCSVNSTVDVAGARMGTADTINQNPDYTERETFVYKYSGTAKNDGSANPFV